MRGWMRDERQMITCCSDGARPVILKVERLDYPAVHVEGFVTSDEETLRDALTGVTCVTDVRVRPEDGCVEVYVDLPADEDAVRAALGVTGYTVSQID